MEVIKTIKEMKEFSFRARRTGKTIALVPTMGYFHEGHLSLMREGRRRGDLLIVSLFVNPTQFGPNEDFKNYPRDFERDSKMAEGVGVDILFAPEASDHVSLRSPNDRSCGEGNPKSLRKVEADPLPGGHHSGDDALRNCDAPCGDLRRERLSTTGYDSTDGQRSSSECGGVGDADGSGGGRFGHEFSKHIPSARGEESRTVSVSIPAKGKGTPSKGRTKRRSNSSMK